MKLTHWQLLLMSLTNELESYDDTNDDEQIRNFLHVRVFGTVE